MTPIQNRYDFVYFFDVKNGNPNGDPDAGNLPRTDQETGHGLVTDVCLKRKVRDYVEALCENQEGYHIYVHRDIPLEAQNNDACKAVGIESGLKGVNVARSKDPDLGRKVREYMCKNFFDVRAFGAVLTSFADKKSALPDCNHLRGPIQFGFARSIDPIQSQEIAISRLTLSTIKEAEEKLSPTMLGRKFIVPYGLYRVDGYISASLASHFTGLSEEDLSVFWKALENMFDLDHSAARGNMAAQKLIVFRHESALGNAPSHKLFERVQTSHVHEDQPPRSFQDYAITIDKENLPDGITVEEKF